MNVAKQFVELTNPTLPVLVDELNDPVGHAYSGMPARLYVIDGRGMVAYKSGRGPLVSVHGRWSRHWLWHCRTNNRCGGFTHCSDGWADAVGEEARHGWHSEMVPIDDPNLTLDMIT